MSTIQDGIQLTDKTVHSFLLIGQSNMAGRGSLSEVPPIANENCFMLRMGRWQPMHEPINPDRAIFEGRHPSGIGLSASFADALERESGYRIGLIPCADGGTSIHQWMPGEILYDHALMMARLAMRTSVLCGILWHQGESDCTSEERFAAHEDRFVTMITALRCELGAEKLPLIIGELSEHIAPRYHTEDRTARMNQVYRRLAEQLPCCGVASAEGLSLQADGLHFDSASYRTFGLRYYEVYQRLQKGEESL